MSQRRGEMGWATEPSCVGLVLGLHMHQGWGSDCSGTRTASLLNSFLLMSLDYTTPARFHINLHEGRRGVCIGGSGCLTEWNGFPAQGLLLLHVDIMHPFGLLVLVNFMMPLLLLSMIVDFIMGT